MGKFRLNILFGEIAVHAYDRHESDSPKTVSQEIEERTDGCYAYKELTFETEGERNAYLQALEDSSGWFGWRCLKDDETLQLTKS